MMELVTGMFWDVTGMSRIKQPPISAEELSSTRSYAVSQVAALVGYHPCHLKRLICQGRIKAFRPNGHEYRISGAEVQRLSEVIDERGSLPPKPETPVNVIYVTPEEMDVMEPGWRSRPSEAA